MGSLGVAAMLSVVVGLPPGAVAPAPGALPPGARVQALDPKLGLVSVELPRRGYARSLARLRRAPGTLSISSQADDECVTRLAPDTSEGDPSPLSWIDLPSLTVRDTAQDLVIGIADTGVDSSRIGSGSGFDQQSFLPGVSAVGDDLGHGTAVAGLIAANRDNIGLAGVAPGVGIASALIAAPGECSGARLQAALIQAFRWFRQRDVSIVNVSASLRRTPALELSLRALQERGVLVVAAAGNAAPPDNATPAGFPASEPHVLGVAALSGKTTAWSGGVKGPLVDLAAPAAGLRTLVPATLDPANETGLTPQGTSFAAPLVTAAAALVWSSHPTWDADRVAAALRASAVPLSRKGRLPNPAWGYGRLDVARALRASVPEDPGEPNDWGHAATRAAVPTLGGTGPRTTTLSASLDPSNDPVDGYAVSLARGERVTATLERAPRGMRICIQPASSSYSLLRCPRDAPASLRATGRAATYLVVVVGSRGGRYQLRIARR
jgi:subtilisin family serine protease